MKKYISISLQYLIILCVLTNIIQAGQSNKIIQLTENGSVKYWSLAGPYEQPLVGFGDPADKEIIPEENDANLLNANPELNWIPKQINDKSFLDINGVFGRTFDDSPCKIWNAKAAYAFAVINSDKEQNVKLLFGGNSISKLIVNGNKIYTNNTSKNAVADEIEKKVTLRKGENYVLIKVFNTHKNYNVSFFIPVAFEWGFYFRIQPEQDNHSITELVNPGNITNELTVTPTFFQKELKGKLHRKVYVDVVSSSLESKSVDFILNYNSNDIVKSLDINFGHNFYEVYIPVIQETTELKAMLKSGKNVINKKYEVEPPVNYKLHLMLLSHMDIGYTNPQPIVKERHIQTLEQAVELAREDENFKWTIETLWQLEQFRDTKPDEDFQELIGLIQDRRFAVSPLYANPYTGWISEMEAIESLSYAAELKNDYGIDYNAVVYNDVPGQSWFLPRLLEPAGIYFVANGINEIFNDYQLQRNLPKVFMWEGSDSSRIINYFNQSYVEGKEYGLTRGGKVVEARTWEKISKIKKDYPYDMILLNCVFTDNAGIAVNQYQNALKWNEEYAYPEFVISTLDQFAGEFYKKYKDELPVIKNDFTSTWDILNQGEFERNIKLRWIQRNINSAAKLSGSLWLADDNYKFNSRLFNSVFYNSLNFTGHGSGMEYGYGNKFENFITDEYRQNFVDNAYYNTEELIQRSLYQLTKPMESFAGFGAVIFNPLSHSRDEIISIEFSDLENADYSVTDISTGEQLNSYYDGNSISFLAKNLPALGYKKFRFVNNNSPRSDEPEVVDNFIENEFYKIEMESRTCEIISVLDKKQGINVVSSSGIQFLTLLKDVFSQEQNVKLPPGGNCESKIVKNNLWQRITIRKKYELLPLIEVTLYNGVKSIDIKTEFDLRKLTEPEITENYNLAFPVVRKDSQIYLDILGGEYNSNLHPDWIGHNSYSIRDYIRIINNDYQVVIASPDARVVSIDKDEDENKFIEINLANNFPLNWNRNEKNEEVLTYDFSITTDSKTGKQQAIEFSSSAGSPSLVRKTWFGDEDPIGKYIDISNPNIVLKSIKPHDDNIILVLQNKGDEDQTTIISSDYFKEKSFFHVNIWGKPINNLAAEENRLELSFTRNEYKYLAIKRNSQSTN